MSSDETVNPAARTVTVWSDLGCPWATLALHTLRTVATERAETVLIDHRVFPLELFNEMPTPKHILDAEIVTIAGHRPEVGWRLWAAAESTYPVTMLPAMEAVQAAKSAEVGGLVASDELDAALRKAFYTDQRCVSIPSVILDVAKECPSVNSEALAEAIARGAGRAEVYRDWRIAQGPSVQGSPHLFAANGYAEHNPGVVYHWTNRPPLGFPRLDDYDPAWAHKLIDSL
ncbi:DsbA family oxidoreductase [Actinokineospora enzanensis]|uniref:DsbA family oxidoreductase n=1 Tax=Actinokineospora enzanensis TaxID=155975 RepID=UPI000361F610|nr:DsbA family protein [Actinokineospora enzanensis]